MPEQVDLYSNYKEFTNPVLDTIRRETFGIDIGQNSWITVDEYERFLPWLKVAPDDHILEVASGSGGPALYVARTTGCRVTGIDANENGVATASQMAANLGEAQRVQFKLVDATAQLPFEKESFDAILSIDAMNHLPNRLDVLRDLRTAGRMKVFIDGRADTVYDRETVERYNRVQRFNQGWQQVIESSGAEYILWPRDSRGRPLAELVQTGRWRILYDDAVSVLLVRSDRFPSQQLQQTPDSGHKRLALGMRSFEQQQYDLSEKELQKAIELLPASSFGCRLLMDVHIKQGRPDEAAEQGRRCQASFPVS